MCYLEGGVLSYTIFVAFIDALKTTGRDLGSKSWWRNEVFIVITQDKTYITAPHEKLFILPTRVLVELPNYKIVAFGHDARPVEYAGVKQAKVIYPCNSYQIQDEEASVVLMRAVMQMVLGNAYFLKPKVFITQPDHTTPFMQELQQLVLLKAGAREVQTVNPLLAIGVGAGLPVEDGHGYAVGWWEDNYLVFGLLAFGNVQYEQKFQVQLRDDADREQRANFFRLCWSQFLGNLPGEFKATLGREGTLVSIDDDDPQLATTFSQAIGQPVQILPRNVEILGLREITKTRF